MVAGYHGTDICMKWLVMVNSGCNTWRHHAEQMQPTRISDKSGVPFLERDDLTLTPDTSHEQRPGSRI